MADNKYEKLIQRQPWGVPNPANPDPDAPVYIGVNQKGMVEGWDEPFTQVLRPIYKPFRMIKEPHAHDCAEYLYFIGGNPMDFTDFGAEVELTIGLGDDAEVYTINSTTWVYLPANLPHCPLDFKRVDKPIMFGHIMFAPGFATTTGFDPDKG
ncbi:MAG: hypothetical protein GX630_04210 [Actinobacteria bacterium]|nr:hypothetical protein [Actinomycetota bacterium]